MFSRVQYQTMSNFYRGKCMSENAFQSLPKFRSNKEMPLIEWAYLKLKEMIFQQTVISGQKLIYKDLCETLNISRTPIINALTRLEQEGYVTSESFRGFYVKPIDAKEIEDKFGVREALEVYAIGIAIPKVNNDDLEILERMTEDHRNTILQHMTRKNFTRIPASICK